MSFLGTVGCPEVIPARCSSLADAPEIGCKAEAARSVEETPLWERLREYEISRLESLGELEESVEFVEAQARWSQCMREQGFRYPNQEAAFLDMQQRVKDEFFNILTRHSEYPEDLALEVSLNAGSDLDALPWYDGHLVEHLAEDEIVLAVADFRCYERVVDEELRAKPVHLASTIAETYESELGEVLDIFAYQAD